MSDSYPRDLAGYDQAPSSPHEAKWHRNRGSVVVNYEEGGRQNLLHGNAGSEAFLSEIVGAESWPGQRHMNDDDHAVEDCRVEN